MKRRSLLAAAGTIPLLPLLRRSACASTPPRRVRPSDPAWPSPENWENLNREVGGQLVRVQSPLSACAGAPQSDTCASLFKSLKNPYFIGDDAALTQSLGWADAWTSQPSVYAVAARRTEDVTAAVNFARAHNLRVVVKGGGHSYHGTSNAPDSLLIWTRRMNAITLHDSFVPGGCAGTAAPQPAVSLGAGVVWAHAYDAVTTGGGRYVQGGGCGTVGVAGLIQSGGFGSFSKRYGLAAAGLLEAEIVTADGAARLANACTNPDLFWALKGGGGGSFGVVTRLTLRTHELPAFVGPVFVTIRAASEAAYHRLIERMVRFYAEALFNPHWGEQIVFRPDNTLMVRMLFQGLDEAQAQAAWRPFLDWLAAAPGDFRIEEPMIAAVPARHFWDPAFMRNLPGVIGFDDRPGASDRNVFWAGDVGEAGQFLHAYQSAWLPATLLQPERQKRLVDALFAATRHWSFSLHFNKGLAGAPEAAVAAARDMATNPAVCDAFALAICAASQQPAYPGIVGREPDLAAARRRTASVSTAMGELRKVVPEPAAYVSESDFFQDDWPRAYWGANYGRLSEIKQKYDPDGLFFVHHGVGSERWSADGFTRMR